MQPERRERGSASGPASGARTGTDPDVDEREQRSAQQRMRDAESGADDNDWA
jgi:hypothetical protein